MNFHSTSTTTTVQYPIRVQITQDQSTSGSVASAVSPHPSLPTGTSMPGTSKTPKLGYREKFRSRVTTVLTNVKDLEVEQYQCSQEKANQMRSADNCRPEITAANCRAIEGGQNTSSSKLTEFLNLAKSLLCFIVILCSYFIVVGSRFVKLLAAKLASRLHLQEASAKAEVKTPKTPSAAGGAFESHSAFQESHRDLKDADTTQ